jgi:hypothetical protein
MIAAKPASDNLERREPRFPNVSRTKRKVRKMNDPIERLKKSKADADKREFDAGKAAGSEWGRDGAEERQLVRLADAYAEHGFAFGKIDFLGVDPPEIVAAAAIGGEPCSIGQRELDSFWENVREELDEETKLDLESEHFVRGFAAGALELWDELKPSVYRK